MLLLTDAGQRGAAERQVARSLHESYAHKRDIWLKEVWTAPTSRTRRCPNAAPAAMPLPTLRPERAPLALWAMPAHATRQLSTATTTTDDLLAVHDDAINSLRSGKQKIPAMALQGIGHEQTGVGGTQWMVLSAAITCLRFHHAVRDRAGSYAPASRSASKILPPTADSWCSTASHGAPYALRPAGPSRPV